MKIVPDDEFVERVFAHIPAGGVFRTYMPADAYWVKVDLGSINRLTSDCNAVRLTGGQPMHFSSDHCVTFYPNAALMLRHKA